jgi:hypothetical protein
VSYRLAVAGFAAATVALAWVLGRSAGLVYLLIYVAATLPGWPLGFKLFGRAHAFGWVTGALIGYALSCLALWGVQVAGAPSTWAFVAAWAVTTALVWGAGWHKEASLVELPVWTKRDTTALCLVLLLAPTLFVFPYKNLGTRDSEGHKHYRAYFTADFVWHTALTAEMTKFAVPPVNPFVGDQNLHYYWTYYLVPAAVAARGPGILADVELCLKLNAAFSGTLFLASVMLFAWSIVPSATAAALGTVLVTIAASAEGNYALYDLYQRGRPLSAVINLNIDAVTAWSFSGLRIDSLARSMWYNPQHSMSCAAGLMALPLAAYAGVRASVPAVTLGGLALATSTIFNPLIGGILSLIYGLVVIAHTLADRKTWMGIFHHAIPALLVGAAVYWCIWNEMVESSEAEVRFGLLGYARNAPVKTLFLSLGPVLVPGMLALLMAWKTPLRVWPAVAGFMVGLGLFYFVNLSVEGSYIGFRAGQILQVSLAPLVALFLARLVSWHWSIAAVAIVGIAAAGISTTLIDTYNAQDITNRNMGPGFRWTVTLTAQEQEGLTWIRRNTAPGAIVQMDPISRGRESWSHIPTFAHRRMWAGKPLLWLDMPPYSTRSADVHQLYVTGNVADACRRARGRIDYLYVGRMEREGMPPKAFDKFSADGSCFSLVFENKDVQIYRIQS